MTMPTSAFAAADARLRRTAERADVFDLSTVTLARLVHFAAKSLADEVNAALKAEGLNYPSYAILVMLFGAADFCMTPSELAAATQEKPANITRLCDDLSRQGLLCRRADTTDRRRVQILLTEQGKARLNAVLPVVMTVIQAPFGRLTPDERLTLGRLLRRLVDVPVSA